LFGNYASLREMNVPMITALYIFVIFLLVIANGFFVASEFALVGVRRTRIAMLAEAGNQRAKLLLELVDNLNAYISATQLGITMASLALGWIGEPVFAHLLEAPLEGRVSDAVRHTVAFAIAFSVITFLHIVLGELAPKTLALERAEKVALAIAWPMRIFYQLFRWPIRMLDWAGTRTVRLFGLHPSSEHASVYTEEELRHLIDISRQSGHLREDEQQLIHRIFEFSDAEVREAMIPRTSVHALPLSASLEETKKAFRQLGYSRLPVYREQLDNIVGVIFRRELEPYLDSNVAPEFNLERLLHPLYSFLRRHVWVQHLSRCRPHTLTWRSWSMNTGDWKALSPLKIYSRRSSVRLTTSTMRRQDTKLSVTKIPTSSMECLPYATSTADSTYICPKTLTTQLSPDSSKLTPDNC
jgi:CBS domain containing-hemolysin-like protein